MKKSILFDANALIGNKSGVGSFSERLLINFSEALGDDYEIVAYYFNFFGMKKTEHLPKHANIIYKEVRFLPTKVLAIFHRMGIQLPYEFFLGFKRYAFAIFPNFVSIPSIRKTPSFIAIHDLSFIDCPEYMTDGNRIYLARFVPKSIKRARGIITISEFTKERLKTVYKISDEDIVTLPIPFEPTKAPVDNIRKKIADIVDSKFVLFVGTIEPRKNIANLVRAFAKLPKSTRNQYKLVLAGSVGWKTEEILSTINETSDDITCIVTNYVSDAERNLLYEKTSLVCLVSHYEGFGMPILEASQYKKPVVLSSLEVFKEIAKNDAYYCDADSPSSISTAIQHALTDYKPKLINISYTWQENITDLDTFIKQKIGVG